MLTRRELLRSGAAAGAVLALPLGARATSASAAPALARYVDELPDLLADLIAPIDGTIRLELRELLAKAHRDLPATRWRGYVRPADGLSVGAPLPGVRTSYLGPTVAVRRGNPVTVRYANALPDAPLFPPAAFVRRGAQPVRINTHLHGGHVSAQADGNPFQTPLAEEFVPGQVQEVCYANDQPAALLFYHDHALHITRQNVYGGMAGGWAIRDDGELALIESGGIPSGRHELPIVLQDHAFDRRTGAQLYPDPWAPEWFGDTPLLNGKAFPFKRVEPRRYRLRLVNGSNSRFYHLGFNRPVTIHQIGTDLGLLPAPVEVGTVLLAPAERADLIVDFSPALGRRVVLRDLPLPAGTVSPTQPLGDLMQFRVGEHAAGPGDVLPASLPGSAPGFTAAAVGDRIRTFTLDEMTGRGGKPAMALIDGLQFEEEPGRTVVRAGSVEEWQIVNLTEDTHPIHVHLVGFQVVSRRPLDVAGYLAQPREPGAATPPATPAAGSVATPAPPEERGWKDTVRANPGEITTIRMRFDLPHSDGAAEASLDAEHRYVMHCHILEHEDNDMMRPFTVVT